MGKKTAKEKKDLELRRDIQMNLANDLAERNPRLNALAKKFPERFANLLFKCFEQKDYSELDEAFKEIYGDAFPFYPLAVTLIEDAERPPSKMVLEIDLSYTKEEILFGVEGFVNEYTRKFKESHSSAFQRKNPVLWQRYIEIWDLKAGAGPWRDAEDGLRFPVYRKSIPWTYEQIAKFFYPEAQEPKDLEKAIDRVKKQYRAACRLICGPNYDIDRIKGKIDSTGNESESPISCETCPDRDICVTLCPPMLEQLGSSGLSSEGKTMSDLGSDADEFSDSVHDDIADDGCRWNKGRPGES